MTDQPLKIAVLMGGNSFEREFSLESGRNITRTLEAAGHTVLPLDTTAALVPTLREQQPDVAYIALHGQTGEDGTIQSLLEFLQIPYVGQTPGVSRLAWNKSALPLAVQAYRANSQPAPAATGPAHWPYSINLAAICFKEMGAATALDLVAERLSAATAAPAYPLAVKPACGGSAMGIAKVEDRGQLAEALLDALSFDDEVLIEEWVSGIELAVGIVGEGDEARALPPVEIVVHEGFFDTNARMNVDMVDYFAPPRPASLPEAARAQVEQAALEVHRAFGCRDLSRVDLIWDGSRPKVLEINTSPGMTEHSLVPMACEAAALPLGDLLEELLAQAIARGKTLVVRR